LDYTVIHCIFRLPPREADFRRILWWSIHGLDVAWSVAHALPPLIHPTTADVRTIETKNKSERKLIKTLIKVNSLMSTIFQEVYGIRQPTSKGIQDLDESAENICADEVTIGNLPEMETTDRFIAMSQRMCSFKMLFILHQPYLRSSQWPLGSRLKALNASQDYIKDFLTGVTDPALAPYRLVLGHFDVIHACAIVLQDLIHHPGSPECVRIRTLVETCLFTFSRDYHPNWEKLEALRFKAWAANDWLCSEQETLETPGADASLSDCDPLFASIIWENMLL
jgi:hypothetical protein